MARLSFMVYVEDLDRVFLFGGAPVRGSNHRNEVWLYDLDSNTWEEVGL